MVNSPLLRDPGYFLAGVALGGPGPLGSHEDERSDQMPSRQAL